MSGGITNGRLNWEIREGFAVLSVKVVKGTTAAVEPNKSIRVVEKKS